MSYEEQNREAFISYFRRGAKGSQIACALGVEVEHFVVDSRTLHAVPYEGREGAIGVCDVLAHLAAFYDQKTLGSTGEILGLSSDAASITLEPAAQIEISIAPYESIGEIVRIYQEFRSYIDPFLAQHGYQLVTQGYHPRERAADLTLIPKERYHLMDEYFSVLHTHGERMMRASASTQVSVDFSDEADAVRKMRITQAIAPFLAAITDTVSCFEGKSPVKPLERLNLWRDVDNARCGSVPGLFDEGYGFAAYADWLLQTCPIFVTRPAAHDPNGTSVRSVFGQSAEQAYADAPMTDRDIAHVISMFWPDVRLKTFVEIRPADSLPLPLVAGYAALIKGLYYSESSLATLEEALGVVDGVWSLHDGSTDEAIRAIRQDGQQALVYGRTLAEWENLLLETADKALASVDCAFLAPLADHVKALQQG